MYIALSKLKELHKCYPVIIRTTLQTHYYYPHTADRGTEIEREKEHEQLP